MNHFLTKTHIFCYVIKLNQYTRQNENLLVKWDYIREDCKDEFYIFTHTEEGKKIYSKRKETVERRFVDLKELFGLRYQDAWKLFQNHLL